MDSRFADAWKNFGQDQDDVEANASDTKWGNLKQDLVNVNKTERQGGESLFLIMEKLSKNDKELSSLFSDIVKAIPNYLSAMDRHTMSKMQQKKGEIDTDDREVSDRARTSAHDNLISCINIFARECQKRGLDTSWRHVLGSNRTDITKWVLSISDYIGNKILK